jgi:N-acyl-D-amino-acid deacylase
MNGRVALLAALVVSLALSGPAWAEKSWCAVHGYTGKQFKEWDDGEAKDYRLLYLNGYDAGGRPLFAALAVKEEKSLESWWHQNLSLDEVPEAVRETQGQGYRLLSINGYLRRGTPAFALVWVRDGQPMRERIGLNLTLREYEDRLALEKRQGFMPSMVSAYADGAGSYRFTALFARSKGVVCKPQHNLTAEQYQKAMVTADAQQLRPISISVYPTPEGLRYAAIFVKKGGPQWQARSDLSAEEYQAAFEEMAKKGLYPISIVGYPRAPTAGPDVFAPALAKFMGPRRIPAATFAVSRQGRLLREGGLSLPGSTGKQPLPTTPMRLASVTKPFTAAAIRALIRDGKLSLDTPVFPLLDLEPPRGQKPDPRLSRTTVRHLLEHKGGWDREKAFDPMFHTWDIAAALQAPPPPGPVDVIRYMLGQPLQFDPGLRTCYSNFGYCVLGRVIEKVSGQPYLAYVQKTIAAPLRINSLALGRSLPKYRNPLEPEYSDPRKGSNVFDPQSKEEVPLPDGGFYLEAMDAHGGLIATSTDLTRFLEAYWLNGEPRKGNGRSEVLFGQLPGTFTMVMQRPNGVNAAVLFNQSTDPSELDYHKVEDVMRQLADQQTGGELRYAALWVKME